jgi:hypothetical protein
LINGWSTSNNRLLLLYCCIAHYVQVNAALVALEAADERHSSDETASQGSAGGTSTTTATVTAATVTAASTADTDKHGRSRALVNADDWVSHSYDLSVQLVFWNNLHCAAVE